MIDSISNIIPSIVDKYWCYDKNHTPPEEVSIFTQEKFYWVNSFGVLFYRSPLEIDKPSNQCSDGEAFLFCLLRQVFPDAIHRTKIFKKEVDVFIPSINVAIEYDGAYYHRNRIASDLEKNKVLNQHNIYVIRVRECDLPRLNDHYNVEITCQNCRYESFIKNLFGEIYKLLIRTNTYRKISPNIIKKLKYYTPEDYDLSNANVGSCYKLRSDDKNLHSNERIINYYKLHQTDLYKIDVWDNLFTLAYSDLNMSFLKDIDDEEFKSKFSLDWEKRNTILSSEQVKYPENINLAETIYKKTFSSGSKKWLLELLDNEICIISNSNLSPSILEKINILLTAISFHKKFLYYYYDSILPQIILRENCLKQFSRKQ